MRNTIRFQYSPAIALNLEEFQKRNLERISKIKSFINNYNWKGINYLSGKR